MTLGWKCNQFATERPVLDSMRNLLTHCINPKRNMQKILTLKYMRGPHRPQKLVWLVAVAQTDGALDGHTFLRSTGYPNIFLFFFF